MRPCYAELHRWATLPFAWGETDCCMVVADWVARQTGIDPAAEIRLTYDGPGSCQRETGFLRDPLTITTYCFEGIAGLAPTDDPQAGDVGVLKVMFDGAVRPVAAICLGGGAWGVKSPAGVTTLGAGGHLGVLKSWAVPDA